MKQLSNAGSRHEMTRHSIDVTSGNRLGIPERVVLALQADGWTWRDTVIWAKKSAMPESLAGWRWERCRVKVGSGFPQDNPGSGYADEQFTDRRKTGMGLGAGSNTQTPPRADYEPCPGCAKCSANDGLVLRQGSWRTTSSHEYIYLLSKGMNYYADGEAVKTAVANDAKNAGRDGTANDTPWNNNPAGHMGTAPTGANRRSVWNDIRPEPYGGSHFATFPSDLPRICIQASTSEAGCCSECGAQWARVVSSPTGGSTGQSWHNHQDDAESGNNKGSHGEGDFKTYEPAQTLGWRPTCRCGAKAVPALVLDPFAGTATTCLAAQRLGRRAVGTDISEAYLQQAVKRLEAVSLPLGT